MSAVCESCTRNITKVRPGVECSGLCHKVFHVKCTEISDDLFRGLQNGSATWLCKSCRSSARKSIVGSDDDITSVTSEGFQDNSKVDLVDVMKLLRCIQNQLCTLEKSQEFICSTMDAVKVTVTTLQADNSALSSRLDDLEVKFGDSLKKINMMEAELDLPNQRQNECKIVINGLPMQGDNNQDLILNAVQKLDGNLTADDINSVEAFEQKINNNSVIKKSFIVELKSAALQRKILTSMRGKKNLFVKDLDVSFRKNSNVEQRISIMQRLTKFQSHLYREAKDIKIKYNFRFLWCKDGQLYLRKGPDTSIIRIYSFNDINDLHKRFQPV